MENIIKLDSDDLEAILNIAIDALRIGVKGLLFYHMSRGMSESDFPRLLEKALNETYMKMREAFVVNPSEGTISSDYDIDMFIQTIAIKREYARQRDEQANEQD